MASVRLGRYELEEYDLPRVCMRCGARASTFKRKKFQWYPPWAFLVLGAFGAALFSKRLTMYVPLCEKHKWHWTGRAAVVGFTLPIIPLAFFAGVALADAFKLGPAAVFIPTGLLFAAWGVMAIVLLGTTIRAGEITDRSITLRGVSVEFVEALKEERRGDDEDRPRSRVREDDEGDRPRRKRHAADDGGYYDPGEKPRRRPSSDAYEEGDERY